MFFENVLSPFLENLSMFKNESAFCINKVFYTYKDFSDCISKIRSALESNSLKNKNVGIVANDDLETYASIFALWLEGLAYVPLHPNSPIERGQEIIKQAQIELILDSSANSAYKETTMIKTSTLIFNGANLSYKPFSDDELAYILFTSGSTGKPKGVPISRKNVAAFMKSFFEVGFVIDKNDKCLQCFDLTFDVSVQSYLTPLLKGACTYTIPHDQIKYCYVYGLLDEHQLTFCVMAPSMLRYLRPYFDELYVDKMKYCIVTAEASPVDLLLEWQKCVPNAEIFDFYGPTEATIYCTYYRFFKNGINKQLNGMSSIGKAMNGIDTIILNENGEILKANQKGELCIAGDQLTPGYWHNPEKNSESFFEMKYLGQLKKFYRTGDSCYFDEEGDILYAGRIDFQVKIQGYRIELGEIEYHAREFCKGKNAVAVSFENKTGNTEIALFVEGSEIETSLVREYLKSKVPNYMIPTKFMIENQFPLNTNGKVDRSALKKLLN